MRFSWCYVGDLCEVRNIFKKFDILNIFVQPIHGWYYSDVIKYREATTKKEQCKLALMSDWGANPTYEKLPIEKMWKEYHEYCPKSKSNNIVFCPEKIIKRKKDEKVQWINDYFKNLLKKSKKKKTKKNGKGRRIKKKTKRKKKKTKSKKRRQRAKRRKKRGQKRRHKGGGKKTKSKQKKTKRGEKKTKRKTRRRQITPKPYPLGPR